MFVCGINNDVGIKMENEDLQVQSSENVRRLEVPDQNSISEQISNLPEIKTEQIEIKSEHLSNEDTPEEMPDLSEDTHGKYR